MKKNQHFGHVLGRSELKNIMGGEKTEKHGCICVCPNYAAVVCNDCASSACFNAVYEACGGVPAAGCSVTT